jgi:hypothetical protein
MFEWFDSKLYKVNDIVTVQKPDSMILDLIETNSIILKDNLSEYMCVFDSKILEQVSEQWKYNRNLNNDKIESICDTIKDKVILDTVLHFFYVNDNGKERLICFDGNHRREALILLYKTKGTNIKICCYIYKCDSVINIDNKISKKFHLINQMTPIPDIYIDILDNLDCDEFIYKRDIIENVFQKYKVKYKSFYSVNSKCRRPNFNDTLFKDLCNNLSFEREDQLVSLLENLNDCKKENISKISKNIIAKCATQNLYLFI